MKEKQLRWVAKASKVDPVNTPPILQSRTVFIDRPGAPPIPETEWANIDTVFSDAEYHNAENQL